MRWQDRDWPERPPRPKAAKLPREILERYHTGEKWGHPIVFFAACSRVVSHPIIGELCWKKLGRKTKSFKTYWKNPVRLHADLVCKVEKLRVKNQWT